MCECMCVCMCMCTYVYTYVYSSIYIYIFLCTMQFSVYAECLNLSCTSYAHVDLRHNEAPGEYLEDVQERKSSYHYPGKHYLLHIHIMVI